MYKTHGNYTEDPNKKKRLRTIQKEECCGTPLSVS